MASFLEVIYGLILLFLALAIISSNSFFIFILRRVQSVNDAPKILMMSLALADLLTGVIGVLPMVGVMFVGGQGFGEHPICIVIAVLMKSIYNIKSFSLLALNLDRYVAVTKALHYHTIMTYKMTLTSTILMWIFALFTSVVNGFSVGWKVDVKKLNLCVFKLDVGCPVFWLDTFFLIVMPFLETILIYIRLTALARHHAAQIAVMPEAGIPNNHNGERNKKQAALKASKTFRIMALVFAMSVVPLLVVGVLAKIEGAQIEWIRSCCLLLTFCSGFFNIMMYFMREKEIRRATNALLYPKHESFRQFRADASARLQQFCCCAHGGRKSPCCACTRACKDSPPSKQSTDDIPEDSVSEVLRLSQVQDEVNTQPAAQHVQRNELEPQKFLRNSGEELPPHIKDSPV